MIAVRNFLYNCVDEMKRVLITVFFILIFAGAALADPSVEFEGRYWMPTLDSKLRVSDSSVGTEIDLKSDLGIKDKDFPEGRFTWYTGENSRIRLVYTQVNFDGNKILDHSIEFSGKTYPAGIRLTSDFDVKYGRMGWIWQFISIGGIVKFGTELDAKLFDVKAQLDAPSAGISESKSFFFGMPTVGLAVDFSPPLVPIDVSAEATGIIAGKYGYCYDAEGAVKFIPIKFVSIEGGYRIFYVKAENDQDFVKLRLRGPFLGATIRF
jgi:hypothetical protein